MSHPDKRKRSNVFERRPGITLTLIIVLSVLGVDILAANVLGALGLYTPPRKFETYYRIRHDVYHHTLAPNIAYSRARWGPIRYQVHTNSLGFKDKSVRHVPVKSDQKRVLFIGDSFTESLGFSFSDSFVGLVSERVQQQGVEVLNAAVTSYSPIIYFKKIEHLLQEVGLEFDHVVALIDISDVLDEASDYTLDGRGNVVSQEAPEAGRFDKTIKTFITENTVLLSHLRAWVRMLQADNIKARPMEEALDQYRSAWTFDAVAYNDYGERGLELAAGHMARLKALLGSNEITLTVVVYPWPDQIVQRDLESRQVVFWRNWARLNQVEFVNLFPDFIGDTDPVSVLKTYFIAGDVHWNADGHKMVAERLLERISFWN